MKIGIDARVLKYRNIGVTRYTENLIRYLSKIDKKNEYKIFIYKNYKSFLYGLGDNFTFIETKIPLFSPFEKYIFPFLLKKEGLDIFHSPYYFIPFIKVCPVIITIHDMISFIFKTSYLHRIEKWHHKKVLKYADHIITVSKYSKNDIKFYLKIKEENISVIYNGINKTTQNKTAKRQIYGEYLLYVGSLQVYKNIGSLLKAFHQIKKEYAINLKLVLVVHDTVGVNAEKTILNVLKQENIDTDDIHILNNITDKDLNFLYRNCKIFVFPSLYEGFGLPVLEAMSQGAPVITSDQACLPEITGNAAFNIDMRDPNVLIKTLKTLLSNEELRKKLSTRGIKRARCFSWKKCASETLAVYKNIYLENTFEKNFKK